MSACALLRIVILAIDQLVIGGGAEQEEDDAGHEHVGEVRRARERSFEREALGARRALVLGCDCERL